MRSRVVLPVAAALVACLLPAPAASGTPRDKPGWLTPRLEERVEAAGAEGVRVSEERLRLECPGVQGRGIGAGGCIVAPEGCTANFVFTDGGSRYVGTARHCVEGLGDTVVMQVDPLTLAAVGEVAKLTPGEDEPGRDFALIRIYPDIEAKWGVSPAIPLIGGPAGVYEGCRPELVKYYGHGYGVGVAQGKPAVGLATNWHASGFGFTGIALPGDSGGPVVLSDRRAAGSFTHIILDPTTYPGSNLAGMRITSILQFAGVRLVNADGSTSGTGGSSCTSATAGRSAGRTGLLPALSRLRTVGVGD